MLDLGATEVPRVLSIESRDASGAATPASETILIAPGRPVPPEVPAPPVVAEASRTTGGPGFVAGGQAPTAPASRDPSTQELAMGPDAQSDSRPKAIGEGATIPATAAAPDRLPNAIHPPGEVKPLRPASTASLVAPTAGTPDAPDRADVARAGPAAPPRLFRTGPDGLALLPAPDPGKLADPALGIEAISYDAAGEVSLAGTGRADDTLRIYLDNAPVALARVGQGGTWSSPLPNVDNGVYTLRIDALAEDGTVLRRIETPFKRTAPDLAAARGDGATAVTVQPGYTLWAISEGHFGEGIRYVQIFERNRDRISDPDLIYPGQVLDLPEKG